MNRRFRIRKDENCISCLRCTRECSFGAIEADSGKVLRFHHERCVDCQRCVSFCPTGAIYITEDENRYRPNMIFGKSDIDEIRLQAETGGVLLSSMGASGSAVPIYFDRMLLNASQVTNPSIDPLREPMEIRTFLGKKPSTIERDENGKVTAIGEGDANISATVYGKTASECVANLKQAMSGSAPAAAITLDEWLEQWIKLYKINKVRQTTVNKITGLLKCVDDKLRSCAINKITSIDVQRFLNGIEFERKREQVYVCLKDAFTRAYKNKLIKENPFDVVEIAKAKRQRRSKALTVSFGPNKGWTLGQVQDRRPSSLKFYALVSPDASNAIKAGSFLLLDELAQARAG